MTYLTFTTEAAEIAAEEQINFNLGLPNVHGTTRWAEGQKVPDEDIWFFDAPPAEGWGNAGQWFTREQMMQGVTDYVEEESV